MKSYLLFLLLAIALISCPEPVLAKEVTLDFWNGFTGPDGKYFQNIVTDFNKEYTDKIKVNMVVMQWADFYNKLGLAIRTKRAPDIGVVHFDAVHSIIYLDIILELDSYLHMFPKDDFVKSAWEVSNYNGRQYGIPLDFHPLVFFWNKDLFAKAGLDPEKPPLSREEFLRVCETFKQAGLEKNGQKVWPCTIPVTWPHFLPWQHIFFCNGGRMFNKQCTRATYDCPAGRDALQFLWDLIHKYEYSPPNVMGIPANEGKESFRRGTSAMLIEGVWMLTSFQETPDLNFGARAMINLGTERHRVMSGSHTLVVFKKRYSDPVKIEASITFAKYISDHSYEWALTGMIPARYSVLTSPKFKNIPYLPEIAADIDKFAFPISHYRYTEGVQSFVAKYLNLCLLNKMSPEAALAKSAEESTTQLQQDPD